MNRSATDTVTGPWHYDRLIICLLVVMFLLLYQLNLWGWAELAHRDRRPVTVADTILMTRLGDPQYFRGGEPSRGVAQFSPSGNRFAVVLRKGNIEQNTTEYSLLLWQTSELSHGVGPRTLLTMSSSSNRPAIQRVSWLYDNETVAFLGEHPGESQQLYTFNTQTSALTRITNHPSNVLSYSISANGKKVAYVAEEPVEGIWTENTMRYGAPVSGQYLFELMAGRNRGPNSGRSRLFYQHEGSPSQEIGTPGQIDNLGGNLNLSPDGRYLLLCLRVANVPEVWKEYTDPWVHRQATRTLGPGESSWLERYHLIDTTTGKHAILLNSPIKAGILSDSTWAPDGRSAVISDVYLPLADSVGTTRKLRQSTVFSVEVKIPSGKVTEITSDNVSVIAWDSTTKSLTFKDRKRSPPSKRYFQKEGEMWREVKTLSEVERQHLPPDVVLEEGMNTAPKIVALSPTSGETGVLLDLNPQFNQLRFAREEEVHWKGRGGRDFAGGLYYPVDYVPGKRYPLVIQTHSFRPDRFWIDGPWTTAFAAQPLAGKNIFVLQADESYEDMNSLKELDREVDRLESAIDDLDKRGFIERDRVGVIGFSRTCLFVKSILIGSKHRVAAASVTDGVDAGYFQYIQAANSSPSLDSDYDAIMGGPPFGEGLKIWMQRSPGFNIDKVHTPLRITALNPQSVLFEWEWYAALLRLGKPVELIMTKDGDHMLQKPWERMISQQGNVDWFAFWLKGEEDSDPGRVDQYVRWRKLRALSKIEH